MITSYDFSRKGMGAMILIFLFQVHARIVVILVQCYLRGPIIRFPVSQLGKWMEIKQEDSYLDGIA